MNKFVIFGDSYSSFEGELPEGYAVYYIPEPCDYSDVTRREDTWWWQLKGECNLDLVRNDSFSGSSVCTTGYDWASGVNAFVSRFARLKEEGFFEQELNIIIVFGGTNDIWSNSPLGEEKYEDITEEDKKQVFPAFIWLLSNLRELYPEANIITVINNDLGTVFEETMNRIATKCNTTPVLLKSIDKTNGHPTKLGMIQIKDQIKPYIK